MKQLPLQAFSMPIEVRMALIAGYVDADGSVSSPTTTNHGRTTIASVNRGLVEDLRELAISCGLRITPVRRRVRTTNFGDCQSSLV